MASFQEVEAKAQVIADGLNADVLFFNGQINPGHDMQVIDLCRKMSPKRENVVLMLVTPGGDAHTAYKITRCLQRYWKKFTVFVPGWCKSAGTLITIGAHHLIIGDFGELGPIDVQRGKADELWETNSGLIEDAAFKSLESAALKMFGDYLFHIKEMSQGQVTFKTASDVATKMIIGQLQPVYAQIDPLKIGENTRAMQVAEHYGWRLAAHSENLKSRNSLEGLVTAYSSHAFVIDRMEAGDLFRSVASPDAMFEELCEAIGFQAAYRPISQNNDEPTCIRFLSKVKQDEIQQPTDRVEGVSPQEHRSDSGGAVSAAETDGVAKVAAIGGKRRGNGQAGQKAASEDG